MTGGPRTTERAPIARAQRGLIGVVLLDAALVVYGLLRFPAAAGAGAIAVLLLLAVYALAVWLALPRLAARDGRILAGGLAAGLLAGLIFAAEILLEYALLPADNSLMGTLEFAAVFAVYLARSVLVAFHTRRMADGVLAAALAACVASLIWYAALLAVFYAFNGTPRQALVLAAEGDLQDFARSGARDFAAWLLQDFLGAGFFHLLLGPLLAGLLGLAGAALGKGLAARGRAAARE